MWLLISISWIEINLCELAITAAEKQSHMLKVLKKLFAIDSRTMSFCVVINEFTHFMRIHFIPLLQLMTTIWNINYMIQIYAYKNDNKLCVLHNHRKIKTCIHTLRRCAISLSLYELHSCGSDFRISTITSIANHCPITILLHTFFFHRRCFIHPNNTKVVEMKKKYGSQNKRMRQYY